MPFRRRPRSSSRKHRSKDNAPAPVAAAAAVRRAAIESLESRMMLTAVINGLFQGTGTPFDGGTIFDFTQPNLGDDVDDPPNVRISISGNLTAEFIGTVFDPLQPDQITLADLGPGTYIFSIYIVKADADCTISIAGIDPTTGAMDPLLDGPEIRTTNAGVLDSQGAVWIGAQTPENLPAPGNNIPIIRSTERVFGMRPSSAGGLFAGIEVAPGSGIGRVYIGGSVTGLVDIPGNCTEFFAVNILTGTANGLPTTTTSDIHKNFHVGGDLENLMALSSFGTITLADDAADTPTVSYNTGFQLDVSGRLGQAKAGDSFLGQAVVHHIDSVDGFGLPQSEVEIRGQPQPPGFSYFDPQFLGKEVGIGENALVTLFNNNDSFDNAQWLGTLRSSELKKKNLIQLRGSLGGQFGAGGDAIDFYSVTLLAGQTIEVQLTDLLRAPGGAAAVRLGIFDSDARLIYTDYSNIKDGTRTGKKVRIKADRPGAYRIAIASNGDVDFNGDGNALVNPYELRVTGTGDIALGGLIVENHVGTNNVPVVDPGTGQVTGVGIQVRKGDLGEVRAGILGGGTIFSSSGAWVVSSGNLRAMEAATIGITDGVIFSLGTGPELLVRNGSVGLLRSTGAGLFLSINDTQGLVASVNGDDVLFPSGSSDLSNTPKSLAIGGDYQLVDSAGSLEGALLANGSIGVIRSADVGLLGTSFPVWQVNVDGKGLRGIIDLIDVSGSLLAPAITTGPSGNVRYMRVGGAITRDPFFGGGAPEATIYAPGEKAALTDDSGTNLVLTPIPLTRNPVFGAVNEFIDPGQLTVLGYPIRDKAGQVLISVTVTSLLDAFPPAALGGGGIQVESGSLGSGGSVEIGQLTLAGGTSAGTLVFNPFTRAYTFTPTVPPANVTPVPPVLNMDVTFRGGSPIDIFEIVGTAGQIINNLSNSTRGEIVNITGAPSVINLSAETLGLSKSRTGTLVEGNNDPVDAAYPFVQQHNLILLGDLVAASSRRGLGNIVATNIGTIRANADGRDVKGVREGIEGPIVARGTGVGTGTTGNIVSVSVGEGLRHSGTGTVGFSGLFADAKIDAVNASGVGHDIRGDIVASGIAPQSVPTPLLNPDGTPVLDAFGRPVVQQLPTFVVGNVRASGGASIIDADIMAVAVFAQSQEGSAPINFVDDADNFNLPVNEINSIRTDGKGGIIGTFVAAADIGPIAVNGGFGLINSEVSSLADSVINGVVTDGYGVRSSNISGGASLRQVIARGTGKRLSTTSFSSSVRQSEKGSVDALTGIPLDTLNDLHLFLGTTKANPKRKGVSDAGNIEDSQFVGSRDLGKVEANRILARNTTLVDPATGEKTKISPFSPAYPMRISFGNSTNQIVTRDVIDGLTLTSGSLELLQPGNDAQHLNVNVAGRIKTINALGALRGNTTIKANGPQGQIDRISTKRSLFATIAATLDIGEVSVGTDLGSPSFTANRNIGTLNVRKSILTGAFVRANRTIFNLIVGRDIKQGARVQADQIANQSIGGEVIGDIVIT